MATLRSSYNSGGFCSSACEKGREWQRHRSRRFLISKARTNVRLICALWLHSFDYVDDDFGEGSKPASIMMEVFLWSYSFTLWHLRCDGVPSWLYKCSRCAYRRPQSWEACNDLRRKRRTIGAQRLECALVLQQAAHPCSL